MHHHRLKITSPSVEATGRLHLGITHPTVQDPVSPIGTGPDHVDNFNHHTTA